jgi:hypothetical protein
MSPRAIRRAAERQGLKFDRTANVPSAVGQTVPVLAPADFDFADDDHSTFTLDPAAPPLSEARLSANRENALKSTGPKTPEGLAKSSLNAVKTGLTGRTVVLPTDDGAIYQQHLDRFFKQYAPATDEEKSLTQSIGDAEWRLLRIAPLEAGIYAVGRRELAAEFTGEDDLVNREALLHAKIFMSYRKDLSNLALQERRLRNQRDTDAAKLERLQKDRTEKTHRDFSNAQALYKLAQKRQVAFDPAFFGFVFSIEELENQYLHEEARKYVTGYTSELTQQQFEEYVAQWRQRQAA